MLTAYLLIAALCAVGGDSVTAHATLEPAEIPFHRVAHYRVTAEGPAETEIVVEAWSDTLPGLRVAVGEPVVTLLPGGRKNVVTDITLSPSMARSYVLPEVRVLADGVDAVLVPAQDLVVRDLSAEEKAELSTAADLYTLDDLGGAEAGSWAYTLLLLLVFTLAFFLLRKLLRNSIVWSPTVSTLPPAEEAAAALVVLERDLASESIACDAFYVALSRVLRTYIGRRFAATVTGQSTPEFLSETLKDLHLSDAHAETLCALMQDFDRVKYAQHTPTRDAQTRSLHLVRDVITAMEQCADQAEDQALRGAA